MPRKGFITPSTFADLMTNTKGSKEEPGKSSRKVIQQLALDLIDVQNSDDLGEDIITPKSCMWGIDHEWEAIQTYQERTFRDVACPVEFRASTTHPYVGGTMDGLIGKTGGIEVKCPFSSIEHLGNLLYAKQLEKQYYYQVQGYMWIFELDWVDFISFDPRFPAPKDLCVTHVSRDDETIERIKSRCEYAHEKALELVGQMERSELVVR